MSTNLPPIPSFDEHEREVKRLWRQCRWMAIGIFVICGILCGMMVWAGMDPARAVAISTIAFQVVLMSYGMGFFVPAFLTSLRRLGLSVHMMYAGIQMNKETVEAVNAMKDDAKSLFKDGRKIVDRLEPVSQKLSPEVIDEVRGYMKDIRDRVVRDTSPLPVNRRQAGEPVAAGDGNGTE